MKKKDYSFFSPLCTFLFLLSCNTETPLPPKTIIYDRTHQPTYQALIPPNWKQVLPEGPLNDTTKPLITLHIDDIRITIHNFPMQQVPPQAQVMRWQKQISNLESHHILPVSWAGFAGLYFEGYSTTQATLGWALALPQRHLRVLDDPQKRAEVTIKAVGSPSSIFQHKEELIAFAKSFELIEEIPNER